MISVVCAYNDDDVLKRILLKSLEKQTQKYEIILLDNRNSTYDSAAEALNYGGAQANGDYIAFVHQDMWLGSDALKDIEKIMESIADAGVAGGAGRSGKTGKGTHIYSLEVFGGIHKSVTDRVEKPEEAETLDECLLIVPRTVFHKLKFDQKVFDGWDCYGTDYSLSVRELNLKPYVIPISSCHYCGRSGIHTFELKGLLKYQKRLFRKHRDRYRKIYTWMGDLSRLNLFLFQLLAILGPVYFGLFPRFPAILRKELAGYTSVLDLGCGDFSPVLHCRIPFSVGVELCEPSLSRGMKLKTHSQFVLGDIRRIEFKPKSFDAVIALNVLEYLTKQEGIDLLEKMEQWAKKRVVATTSNGLWARKSASKTRLKKYKFGWKANDLTKLGYRVNGIEGWKGSKELKEISNPLAIGFLQARFSNLTQKICYHHPRLAITLLAVKNRKKEQ